MFFCVPRSSRCWSAVLALVADCCKVVKVSALDPSAFEHRGMLAIEVLGRCGLDL